MLQIVLLHLKVKRAFVFFSGQMDHSAEEEEESVSALFVHSCAVGLLVQLIVHGHTKVLVLINHLHISVQDVQVPWSCSHLPEVNHFLLGLFCIRQQVVED